MFLIYLYGALIWAIIGNILIFDDIKNREVDFKGLFLFFYFTFISWFSVLVLLLSFIFFYLKENIDLNKKIF